MKRILFLLLLSLMTLSCSEKLEKTVDSVVGVYSLSCVSNVVWGDWTDVKNYTGTLTITKISDTKVQTDGYFRTVGEVVGSSIYFEPLRDRDSEKDLTGTFHNVKLNGNVLTFTILTTGNMMFQGSYDPYRGTESYTCIKK